MSNYFPSFVVRWILNFVDQPTHENHENWYPTNKIDFIVNLFFLYSTRVLKFLSKITLLYTYFSIMLLYSKKHCGKLA